MHRGSPDHDIEHDVIASIALGDDRHLLDELTPEDFTDHATVFAAMRAAHRAGTFTYDVTETGEYHWCGVDDWVDERLRRLVDTAGILTSPAFACGRLTAARRARTLRLEVEAAAAGDLDSDRLTRIHQLTAELLEATP